MPETSIQRQEFQQKKPYLVAAAFTVAVVVFAIGWFYAKVVSIKRTTLDELKAQVHPLMQKEAEMSTAKNELDKLKKETDKIVALVELRGYWGELLNELRRVMLETEQKSKQKLNTDVGLWIETFTPKTPDGMVTAVSTPMPMQREIIPGLETMPEAPPPESFQPPPQQGGAPGQGDADANAISSITVVCRGVDLEKLSPTANSDLAYALKAELEASPFFVKDGVELEPIKKDENALTFSLGMTVKLKRPFKTNYAVD